MVSFHRKPWKTVLFHLLYNIFYNFRYFFSSITIIFCSRIKTNYFYAREISLSTSTSPIICIPSTFTSNSKQIASSRKSKTSPTRTTRTPIQLITKLTNDSTTKLARTHIISCARLTTIRLLVYIIRMHARAVAIERHPEKASGCAQLTKGQLYTPRRRHASHSCAKSHNRVSLVAFRSSVSFSLSLSFSLSKRACHLFGSSQPPDNPVAPVYSDSLSGARV